MSKLNTQGVVPDELIMNKIYYIREQKIMIDRDLSELYGVQTKRLKEAVRRNVDKFPGHFMFEMTKDELQDWRTQIATSNFSDKMGLRYAPFCFTEHGVLQLANVLKSGRATQMSVRIIEVFIKMREMLLTHKDILLKLEQIENKLLIQDGKIHETQDNIQLIFAYIKELLNPEQVPRKKVGYKI